ncbi:MAG: Wzz/FepE/Etk N-terminal domain-containing protein [Prochlorococcus marinus CUG1437]|nr:Wzz/FepE/Etk N-terminal domain-containing protein [Prochlorococcus marinus CUG1437]
MQNKIENNLEYSSDSFDLDEIDLREIFLTFLRNKKLIIKITFLSLFLGLIQAYSTKRIWEGQFQIVLSNETSSNMIDIPDVALIAGIQNNEDPLMTEVGILKSPLVLSKVFDYVKEQKSDNKDKIPNIIFKDWRKKSLSVDLEKNTTILNISYKDNDKSLVIPVLEKISKSYQEYSGRKRLRNIQLGKEFFENQIDIYKNRSTTSLIKAQTFAIEQDLAVLKGDSEMDKEIINDINIENIRVNSANKIRNINFQLEKLAEINDDDKILQYIGNSIPQLSDTEFSKELKSVERELAFKRLSYLENDKSINQLIKQRNTLISIFKKQIIGFLEAEKVIEMAKLKSAERPKGILIEYRQLLSNVAKDKNILNQLETQYRTLLLDEARIPDPWELITSPTLLINPVSPNKKLILLIWLFIGLISGCITSYIFEKNKNIIYSLSDVKAILKLPILKVISPENQLKMEQSIEFLFESRIFKKDNDIAFIAIGELDRSVKKILEEKIKVKKKVFNIDLISDYKDLNRFSCLILIISLGATERTEIVEAKSNLLLIDNEKLGILVFN